MSLSKKHELSKRQLASIAHIQAELEKHRTAVSNKLAVIHDFVHEQDVRRVLQQEGMEPCIELFHGIDGYDISCEALSLHTPYKDQGWEVQQIFGEWYNIENAVQTQGLEEGEQLSLLYADIREDTWYRERIATFFNWIVGIWHDLELYKIDLNAYTVQNNSIEMFDLNRCAWHGYLTEEEKDFEKAYQHTFPFPFSKEEIKTRIGLQFTKQNVTYWRHLKLGDQMLSRGLYQNEAIVYQHEGAFENPVLLQKWKYDNRSAALQAVQQWVDEKMHEGYREFLIEEDTNWRLTTTHLHFDILTLFSAKGLSANDIQELEAKSPFPFSTSYRHFLMHYHGAFMKADKIGFPVNNIEYGRLNRFYWPTLEQLHVVEIEEKFYRIIADTQNAFKVLMCEEGKVYWDTNTGLIELASDFEAFLQSLLNYEFSNSIYSYYAEIGDIAFFEEYLKTNYIDNRDNLGKTALQFASSHNQIALAKFLLEKGANPNFVPAYWVKSEEMLDLLMEYHYDPHYFGIRSYPQFKSNLEHWPLKDKIAEQEKESHFAPVQIIPLVDKPDNAKDIRYVENYFGVQLPDDYKQYLSQYEGVTPEQKWFFLPINSGSTLKIKAFYDCRQMVEMGAYLKSIENRSPFYKKVIHVPIAETTCHSRIVLEYSEGHIEVAIENQYELDSYSSARGLQKGENCFTAFLNALRLEEEIFFDEAWSIVKNDVAAIQKLLQKGWHPNYAFRSHGSPLSLAIYMNHFEIVDLLLDNGAYRAAPLKSHDVVYSNRKPLVIAMVVGTLEMVEHLIAKDILIFDPSPDYYNAAKQLIENRGRAELEPLLEILKVS